VTYQIVCQTKLNYQTTGEILEQDTCSLWEELVKMMNMTKYSSIKNVFEQIGLFTIPFAEHFWTVNHAYKEKNRNENDDMSVYTQGMIISVLKGITATLVYSACINDNILENGTAITLISAYTIGQVATHIISHKVYSKNISLEEKLK
jgi:hypothetical protein